MEGQTPTWVNMLISWAPFLILIGFWIYFMRQMRSGSQAKYMARSHSFMDRQEQLLERIAVALEERNRLGR
jgi:ATP-dependent Zn protease